MVEVRVGWKRDLRRFAFLLCSVLLFAGTIRAQEKAPKKKSSSKTEQSSIHVQKGEKFVPTQTGAPGTVKRYFWPTKVGTMWQHRTIRVVMDDSGKVLATDTAFNIQHVVSDSGYSLQGLKLIQCESQGYRAGGKDTAKATAFYYVDDSIAMAVVNNSVSHRLNSIFLVAPVRTGNAWHEKYDDSVYCMISGWIDSVVTPMRMFDSALVTVTWAAHTELLKFYVEGFGLVKSVFRAPGPGGHGLVAMVTEMVALKPPDPSEGFGK